MARIRAMVSNVGPELLKFKIEHKDFCLGPTHEEVITDLVRRNDYSSYKQLPCDFVPDTNQVLETNAGPLWRYEVS